MPLSRLLAPERLPYALLIAGLSTSVWLAAWLHSATVADAQARFERRTEAVYGAVRGTLLALDTAIAATEGLFDHSGPVTPESFERFVAAVDPKRIDPAVRAVWFAPRLRDTPPAGSSPAAVAAVLERWPITLITPIEGNELLRGLDISQVKSRADLLERTLRSGGTAVSGRIGDYLGAGETARMVMMRSVGAPAGDAVSGVVAIAIALDDFLTRVAGPALLPDVLVTLSVRHPSVNGSPGSGLLFRNHDPARVHLAAPMSLSTPVVRERIFSLGDADIVLRCEALDAFIPASSRWSPLLGLVLGLLLTAAAFVATRRLVGGLAGARAEATRTGSALAARETTYRALADALRATLVLARRDGTLVYANHALRDDFGIAPARAEETSLWQLFAEQGSEQGAMATLAAYLESGTPGKRLDLALAGLRPDGSVFPIEASFSHVVLEGEHRFLGLLENVTGRRDLEAALAAERASLAKRVEERTAEVEDLYNNAPCGYHSVDGEGFIVRMNDTELEWLGYKREEVVGRMRFPELLTEPGRAIFAREFDGFRERGWITDLEFELIRRDGSVLPVLVSATAVRDAAGRYVASRSTVFDITERRRAENAVLRSRDELREANAVLMRASRLKDEFLANMSHELRTPLNAVLMLAESLDEGVYGSVTDEQRAALRNVIDSGRHLLGLISDVLDLAKIEAGRVDLDVETVAVAPLCEAVMRMIREHAQQRRHQVDLDVQPPDATVLADPRRLRQILVNLVGNAIKFTPPGGHIGLEVRGDAAARRLTFTVRDDGPGIPEAEQAALFQPFVQVDSGLDRQHEGTGLGLALVRRLADLHGGSVTLDSVPGRGSAFSVAIPWDDASAPAEAQPAEATRTPMRPLPSRALIVEDSLAAARRLALHLEELGVKSSVVSDAERVHDTVLALRPDLVMLDLLLPEPRGWEVLAALKADARTARIPVIVTSVVEGQARARTLGAEGYLLKPFDREDLRAVMIQIGTVPPLEHGAVVAAVADRARPDPGRALRVLVAEDNPVSNRALCAWLQSRGIEVDVAANGAEAVAAAGRQRPDLILMDVQMPGMDGLEATRVLRADAATRVVPVVALTALAMPGDRARCLAAGMDAYLSKPVSHAVLAEELERFLGPLPERVSRHP